MSDKIAIEIKNLSYRYKGNWLIPSKSGIHNINLEVKEGEAFGFLGSNGAGKTTTIKLLLGLTFPREGTCKIFGIPSENPEARKNLGYISEQPYFYDNLKVIELMKFYAALKGIKGKEATKECLACLERVGLSAKIYSRPRSLSKGLTQRVALAQALLGKPRLLILDEPLSGLDPVGRREFMSIFQQEHKSGTTIFMSSHILNDVESLCDRVSIMKLGEVKALFDTKSTVDFGTQAYEAIFSNFHGFQEKVMELAKNIFIKNEKLHVTINTRENLDKVLEVARAHSCILESLLPIRSTLEDIFIEITNKKNS